MKKLTLFAAVLAAVGVIYWQTIQSSAQTVTVNLPVTLTTNQINQLQALQQIYGLTNLTLKQFATNVLNTQISPSALNLLRQRQQRLIDLVSSADPNALTVLETAAGLPPMTTTNTPSTQ